jgi:hypothetical protein
VKSSSSSSSWSRAARARSLGLLVAAVLATAGCSTHTAPLDSTSSTTTSLTGPSAEVAAPAIPGSALDALASVAVKGRATTTGYTREQFGQAWADVDRNGCDTRNDVLRRDISGAQLKDGTQGCVVATGTLADPYSGTPVPFQRGEATSSAVQIDHVVALSDAWQTGAQQLTLDQRTALANDPLNLLAVDGPLNQQKSDGDAASWLPPNTGYRCSYVARQVAVKATYGLWVTPAEHDAIASILAGCPGQLVPQPAEVATPGTGTVSGPTPVATTAPADAAGPVVYANCAQARAAGAAPIYAGQPGYSAALDGNSDGVACS